MTSHFFCDQNNIITKKVNKQRGVINLALPLLLLLIAAAGALIYFGVINNPFKNLFQKGLKVTPKSEYQNPFKKETQYVNPFETYKNPFTIAK